jgi:hypothetical protein
MDNYTFMLEPLPIQEREIKSTKREPKKGKIPDDPRIKACYNIRENKLNISGEEFVDLLKELVDYETSTPALYAFTQGNVQGTDPRVDYNHVDKISGLIHKCYDMICEDPETGYLFKNDMRRLVRIWGNMCGFEGAEDARLKEITLQRITQPTFYRHIQDNRKPKYATLLGIHADVKAYLVWKKKTPQGTPTLYFETFGPVNRNTPRQKTNNKEPRSEAGVLGPIQQ